MVEAMEHSSERLHYLSLALDARLAIKALRQTLPSETTAAELRESVRAALDSLKAASRGGAVYAGLGDLEPYENFEQIYMLQEVASSVDSTSLMQQLQGLLETGKATPEAKTTALKFFAEVERRALHYYSDPSLSEQSG